MLPGLIVKQQAGAGIGAHWKEGTKGAEEEDRRGGMLVIFPLDTTGYRYV